MFMIYLILICANYMYGSGETKGNIRIIYIKSCDYFISKLFSTDIILFGFIIVSALACTILSAKSDSDFMFCLQSYQGLINDKSRMY